MVIDSKSEQQRRRRRVFGESDFDSDSKKIIFVESGIALHLVGGRVVVIEKFEEERRTPVLAFVVLKRCLSLYLESHGQAAQSNRCIHMLPYQKRCQSKL